jgi:hypothetical protein
MNPRIAAILTILLAFGAYSLYAMLQVGYFGIWQAGFASVGSLQVLLDLIIVCLLVTSWMLGDARSRGLNAWPFVLITVAAGSFGPLLYLLYRELRAGKPALA